MEGLTLAAAYQKLGVILTALLTVLSISVALATNARAADDEQDQIAQQVATVIRPIMGRYGIPGMAVGIVRQKQSRVFNYGLASKSTGKPITDDTLFEIGSDSKIFTATLAAYAQATGKLSLSAKASEYFPILRGSHFDQVSLINLGTHTSGGLPLQVPDEVTNNAQLFAFFQSWTPAHAPGVSRTYGNPGIGLLGMIAAKSMNEEFVPLLERTLFPALGLRHTYLVVPEAQRENYAQGYTAKGKPIRMAPGMLGDEAYGIRTTAADLLRVVRANLGLLPLDEKWQRAIIDTHTGYYRMGAMTQDLIWEQYSYPVALADLLAGNSPQIMYQANPVQEIRPPAHPRDDVFINKSGSTNGFAAYVAFIPAKKAGIVILANRSYPMDARVAAAYSLLTQF